VTTNNAPFPIVANRCVNHPLTFNINFDFIDTDLSTFYSIQDCCGKGTSGDETTQYCLDDPDWRGFDGSYSLSWESDCALHVCCEQNCYSEGLEYDKTQALCIPDTYKEEKFQVIKPFNGEYIIDQAQLKDMYFCRQPAYQDLPGQRRVIPFHSL
jgi:hypothetical protein